MSNSTMSAFGAASAIADVIKKLRFEKVDLSGQEAQGDVIAFYSDRIKMLHEDGVDDAVFSYLKKLLKDDSVNQYTKLLIEKYAMEVLDGEAVGK